VHFVGLVCNNSVFIVGLEGVGCQGHALVASPPGKNPGTHWIGGWVGPRSGLEVLEDWKSSWSCRD